LIRLGHANELNSGLPVGRPSHDAQLNAHRPVLVELHPKLHALARF
jgi:hypothetical protein